MYFSGHPGDFFSGGDQIDRGHAAVPGAVIGLGALGEECFLRVVQRKRPMSFIVGQVFSLYSSMPFFRQTGQHGDGFARRGKDGLFLCPAVPGERDGDGVGLLQDLL